MPLWRLVPIADRYDSRWQDRQIWHDLIVRAPTAAMARIYAERWETRDGAGAVGNETRAFRGGFADANLYWVQRVGREDAKKLDEKGPDGVVREGRAEQPALSVYYGASGARRQGEPA
jgi:hypothetical protein